MNGQDDYRSAGALSSRLDRVWAVLIDWGLAALFPLFGLLGGLSWASKVVLDALATGRPGLGSRPTGPVATLLLASTVATVLLALYQLYSLAVRGQTLGKRLMGIQIVDDAGRPAGFFRAVLLRSWVFGLLTGLVQGCLSIAGIVVPLVDALFIFGDERRTLHDLLAGTWVRDAAEAPRRAAPALAAVKPAVVAGAAENGGFAVDKMHKVSGGDTLWGLSGKYYSDPYKWGKIYNANLNTVENPDRIYPREELIIPGITEEVSPVRKAPVAISGSDTVTEGDLSVTEVKPAAVPAAARKKASARSVVMSDDLDSFARNDLSAEMPKDQKEWSVFTKVVPDDWEADGVVTAREHTSSDSVDEGLSFSGETVVIKRSGSVQVREGDYFTIYLTGAAAFDKRGKNIGRELQPAGTAEVVSVKGRVVKARIVDASTTIRKGMVVKINVRS